MGQLVSRQQASNTPQNGRRQYQFHRRYSRIDDDLEATTNYRSRGKSPVQYRDYGAARARSNEAGTHDRGAHPRPPRRRKDDDQSKSRKVDPSEYRKRSSRKKTSGAPKPPRPPNSQTEASRQHRSKLKSPQKQPRSSTSVGRNRTQKSQQRESKDCIICADTRSFHRFPNRPPTTQCKHDIDVCRRCLRTWMQTEFAVKIWDEINCPTCSARMQYEDMREFASKDVFRR